MTRVMGKSAGKMSALRGAIALAIGCAASGLTAQSVPDFSIPAPRPAPNPRAQGPIDAENPVVRPSEPAPAPSPSASPRPSPSPSPIPSSVPAPVPQPRPDAAVRASAPATAAPRAAPLPAGSDQAPATAPTIEPPAPIPLPSSTPNGSFDPPAPLPTEQATAAPLWPWLLGLAAGLAALAAWLLRRRRIAQPQVYEFEAPIVPAPPLLRESVPPPPLPLPPPLPTIAPVLAAAPQGLAIALEAKRMSASLMATTLSYALTVTNHSPETLSALAIEGDMIAAHASLPPERQIASAAQQLELRHALVTLAPGESAQFNGDFRLPLNALNPIRAGDAAYFVPLARLRVAASDPAGRPVVQVQTFVVGELGVADGAGLRPFRLDLGPRTYSRVSQRAVS